MRWYFPWIPGGGLLVGGQGDVYPCGMTVAEWTVFRLLRDHPDQRREGIRCDARLVAAARERCELFRQENKAQGHYPKQINPHATVRAHGYRLPDGYPNEGQVNFIESAAIGQRMAREAVEAWLNSDGHRRHVLGGGAFVGQTVWGVGFSALPSEPGWRFWWTFLTCPPE